MDTKAKQILVGGVKAAGEKIRQLAGQSGERSKVTGFDYGIPADKQAEDIILEAIHKSALNCSIISEEAGLLESSNPEYKIYVDPLDGSVNFSRGIPSFCLGLGVYSLDNEPLLGVVYDPSNNELFVGESGQGVTVNGKKISPQTLVDNILINLEWFGAVNYLEIADKLKQAGYRARTAGSGVLALCYGVTGRGDAAVLIKNAPWDIAPGMVFAYELGYIIKQVDGSPIDLSVRRQDAIAAPPELFEKISQCLN